MNYQFFSSSQGHPSKPANGDHTLHLFLPDTDDLVLAVSDGVSSHDYDWQASQTTCDACMRSFSETNGEYPQRLQEAMESANDDVQSLRGQAQGALATLILAVYEHSQRRCHFSSIGDSRVFKVGSRQAEQLTEDDARFIVLKQGGELLLRDGAVVSRQVITQAIGQTMPLDIHLQSTVLKPGEMLVMATDGCYELPGFNSRMIDIQRHSNLETAARTLIMDLHRNSGLDDGTVAIIRRQDCPEDLENIYLEAFDQGTDLKDSLLIGHLMLGIVIRQMIVWAADADHENLVRGLNYLKKEKLSPCQEDATKILDHFKDDSSSEALRAHREITRWIMNF